MNDKHVRSRMANTLKIMQDLIWLMNGTTDQLMFWAFIIAGCFETCSYITQYALNCFSINPPIYLDNPSNQLTPANDFEGMIKIRHSMVIQERPLIPCHANKWIWLSCRCFWWISIPHPCQSFPVALPSLSSTWFLLFKQKRCQRETL